ncbi:MFS transporter [Streptomyces tubercidicus]|uniref:MFS transporter n=1 Tax=Streptomyces tubercidicus TaxID=47759 RepID=UPI003466AA9C
MTGVPDPHSVEDGRQLSAAEQRAGVDGRALTDGRAAPEGAPGAGITRGPGAVPGQESWSLVVVAGMLAYVAMLDMNIVNVALSEIGDSFGIAPSTAQWAQLSYQLPVIALLLPVGRMLDRVPMRPVLLAAVSGFALFSIAASAAPWAAWLFGVRLLQGCCAAVLFVMMPVLAVRAVRPDQRGRAMSVPATLGPLGAITGPTIGGLLLDHVGWQAVFLLKIPFCLVALVVAARVLPRLPAPATSPEPRRGALSGVGFPAEAALIGGALATLLLALTLSVDSPAWLLLAVAAVPPLVLWLRSAAGRSTTGLLREAGTWGVVGSVFTLAAGFASMHYVLALHLQRNADFSATQSGLALFAFPCAMGLAGPLGGRLSDRFGPRPLTLTGAALVALGLALLSPLDADWTSYDIAWRLAIAGLGMGLNGGPTQTLAMTAAPPGEVATAGSLNQLFRNLGFALGPALATAAGSFGNNGAASARAGLLLALALACCSLPMLWPALGRRRTTGG